MYQKNQRAGHASNLIRDTRGAGCGSVLRVKSCSGPSLGRYQRWGLLSMAAMMAWAADTTPPTVPGVPVATRVLPVQVEFSWTPSTDNVGVSGYIVYNNGVQVSTSYSSSTLIYGQAPGTAFSLTVKAQDAAGNLSDASPALVVTLPPDTTVPTVPGNLTVASRTDTTMTVTWAGSSDVDGVGVASYRVMRGTSDLGTTTGTSFVDAGLTPQQVYSYRIIAIDKANNASAPSIDVSGRTLADQTAPAIPTGVRSTTTTLQSVALAWDAVADPSGLGGYGVFCNGILRARVTTPAYTVAGLAPSKSYYFQVSAYDVCGNESEASRPYVWISTLTDSTPPTAPTGVLSSNIKQNSVTLSWTPASDNVGVVDYLVYRSGSHIGTAAGTTYVDEGLASNTAYSYTVSARDGAGNSGPASATLGVTTPPDTTPPTVPGIPFATAVRAAYVNLTWFRSVDDVGVTAYEVAQSGTVFETIAATSTSITYPAAGTTLAIAVRARDAAGNWSAWSPTRNVSIPADTEAPNPPVNLLVSGRTASSLTLAWTAPDSQEGAIMSYDLYRNGSLLAGLLANGNYVDASMVPGMVYTYAVRSRDTGGNVSLLSVPISASLSADATAPTAPTGLIAGDITMTSAVITWSAGTDNVAVAGYRLYADGTLVASSASTTCTLTGLAPRQGRNVVVRAFDSAGNLSPASAAVRVVTLDDTVLPTTPTSVTASNIGLTSAQISWVASTDNIGVDHYAIVRNGRDLYVNVRTLTFVDTSLAPGSVYTYVVRAMDVAGNFSLNSTQISLTTLEDTTAPVMTGAPVLVERTPTTATIAWPMAQDNVGVVNYELLRDGVSVIQVSGSTTQYVHAGLLPGSTGTYTVRAKDAKGAWSPPSPGLVVTLVGDANAPTTPTNLMVNNRTDTGVYLYWTGSSDGTGSGVIGYRIQRNGVDLGLLASGAGYTMSGLTESTAYTFAVRAQDAAGNMSAWSVPLNVKTQTDMTPPTVPAGLRQIRATPSALSFAWDASTDANGVAGYDVKRDGVLIAHVSGTSFTDTEVTIGKTYSYAVRAFDAAGNFSAESYPRLSVSVPNLVPPSSVWARRLGRTNLRIEWFGGRTGNATQFRVFRNGVAVATVPLPSSTNTVATYLDTGLTPNTDYRYRITSLDASGAESAQSVEMLTNTTSEGDELDVVAGLTAATNATQDAVLSWTAHPKAGVTYVVLRRDGNGTRTLVGATTSTSFTDLHTPAVSFADSGMINNYGVIAIDDRSNTSPEAWVSIPAPFDDVVPEAPIGVVLQSATGSEATVAWTRPADPRLTISVAVFENSGAYSSRSYVDVPGTSLRLNGLKAEGCYIITVSTCRRSGLSTGTSLEVRAGNDTSGPSTPTLVLQRTAGQSVYLQWLDGQDAGVITQYEIARNGNVISTRTIPPYRGQTATFSAESNTYVDDLSQVTGLLPGAQLAYAVRGIDHLGHRGVWSNPVIVTLPRDQFPPGSPQDLRVAARTGTSLTLTWIGVYSSDLSGFIIKRAGVDVATVPAIDPPPPTYSWTDMNLPNAIYSYEVYAIDTGGNLSVGSSRIIAEIATDTQAPAAPGQPIVTSVSKTGLTVSWTASTDDVGVVAYQVLRDGVRVGMTTGLSWPETGLSPGHAYVYQVLAQDGWANVSPFSSATSATTLADTVVPSTPTGLIASSTTVTSANLSWNASTDDDAVAGYEVRRGGALVSTMNQPVYVDRSLAPGTTYVFGVQAVDRAGNRSGSASVSVSTPADTLAPFAPPGAPVASVVTMTGATLTWAPAVDNAAVTNYRLLRNGAVVATVTGLSVSDTGLAAGTAYSYTVVAVDAGGRSSPPSGACSVTTLADVISPNPPTNLAASAITAASVALTWGAGSDPSPGSGVKSYDIYRGGTKVGSSTTTSWTDAGVTAGTAYVYTVRSLDAAARASADSVALRVMTRRDVGAPSIPVVTLGSVTATSVALNWTAATDGVAVSGYDILRDNVWIASAATATTTWTDTVRLPGTSATYALRAADAAGNRSAASASVVGTTLADTMPPSAPAGLTANGTTATGTALTWTSATDNIGLRGYEVLREGAVVGSTSALTLAISGLTPSMTYACTVRAVDLAGNRGPATSVLSVTTLADTTAPSAPASLVSTSMTMTSVGLSWLPSTDNVGVIGYDVLRDGVVIGTSPTTSYTDVAAKSGVAVSYSVKARDAANRVSAASPTVTVTALSDAVAPAIPANFVVASRSGNTLNLSWSAATDIGSGIADYQILKNDVVMTTVTGTTASSGALTAGVAVTLTVRARDRGGNLSANAVPITLTPSTDVVAPTAPSGLTKTAVTSTTVSLSWTAATDGVGVSGYVVRRGGQVVARPSSTSLVDAGLTPGVAFSYTVAAIDANLNEGPATAALSVTTTADSDTPSSPGSLTASGTGATTTTLTWTASSDASGISGYQVRRGTTLVTTVNALTAVVTGLSPGVANSVSVTAIDRSGKTSAAATLSVNTPADTTPPAMPATPGASNITQTAVTLQWLPSTDDIAVTGWELYRDVTKIASLAAGVFTATDSGLVPGKTYAYTVRCRDAAGNWSLASGVRSVTTKSDTRAPDIPRNLTISGVTDRKVVLGWAASTDPEGTPVSYQVLRGATLLATVTATTYTDQSGLTPNTAYSYTVKAVDAAGLVSAASLPLAMRTATDAVLPAVVAGVIKGTVTTTTVPVSWSAATDDVAIAGYRIYRGTLCVGYVTSGTTFTDTVLVPGTAYSYTVRSVDTAGNIAAASAALNATTITDAAIPATPASMWVSSKGATWITLAWNASSDDSRITSYSVARNGSTVATVPNLTCTITGLRPSTAYSFTVKATDAANKSSPVSSALNVSTSADLTAPTKPVAPWVTSVTPSSVSLTWLAPTDDGIIAGYTLYRNGNPVVSGTTTSLTDITCQPGTTYIYTIVAYDTAYRYSAASDGCSVTTPGDQIAPTVPANLRITASQPAALQIAWDAASDNGGSGVVAYDVTVDGVEQSVPAGITTLEILQTAGSRVIRVAARDLAGNRSNPSPYVIWTSINYSAPLGIPANPRVVSIAPDASEIAWDSVDGAQGYIVLLSTGQEFYATASPFMVTTYGPGQGGYFSVAAVNRAGQRSDPSDMQYIYVPTEITAPSVPANIRAAIVRGHTIKLTWDASTDNDKVESYTIACAGRSYRSTTTSMEFAAPLSASITVTAWDRSGNRSAAATYVWQHPGDLPLPPAPPVPLVFAAEELAVDWDGKRPFRISLEWLVVDSPSWIRSYEVEYSSLTQAATVTSLATANPDPEGRSGMSTALIKAAFVIPDVMDPDVVVRIRAVDDLDQRSAWTELLHIPVPAMQDTIAPTAPAQTVIVRNNGSDGSGIRVIWTAAMDSGVGVLRYEVLLNGSVVATRLPPSCEVVVPIGAFASPTVGNVTVRAVDYAGNRGAESPAAALRWSNQAPQTPPRNVGIVASSPTGRRFVWEPPDRHVAGIVGYRLFVAWNDDRSLAATQIDLPHKISSATLWAKDASGNLGTDVHLSGGIAPMSPISRTATQWISDKWADAGYRTQYLSGIDVTRVWDTAAPGPGVPILRPAGQLTLAGPVMSVTAAAGAPVTFLSLRSGSFSNGQSVITVQAGADGVASVTIVDPGRGRNTYLVASPMASGRLTFSYVVE